MRVAIVHDWFVGGGAERVVYELHKMFPEAPIYTSYCSPEWQARLGGVVKTGYLQRWPFSKLRKFLPLLRLWWFSSLDLSRYDLVISSSGAEAKGVKTPPSTLHVNYCHAPTHYYWNRYDEYINSPGFGILDPLARLGLKLLVGPLRRWDYKAAQRPDFMIANSNYTKAQIRKYYGREATVVHPPVEIERFKPKTPQRRAGLVTAGRQTPYKKIDLAVQACSQLGLNLTVIGDGPDNKKLRQIAGPTVRFTGRLNDAQVAQHFQKAEGFIFPGVDDFGIVAVEAMAAGTPVIAYKAGGAMDYVNNKTGLLFDQPTADGLAATLKELDKHPFVSADIIAEAEKFSNAHFRQNMKQILDRLISRERTT